MTEQIQSWQDANRRYLAAALGVVRQSLLRAAGGGAAAQGGAEGGAAEAADAQARRELEDAAAAMPYPSALDRLCGTLDVNARPRGTHAPPSLGDPWDLGAVRAIGRPEIAGPRNASDLASTTATIEIHIESLVLHGVTPGAAQGLGESVRRELERLLAGQPLPARLAHGREIPAVDAGEVRPTPPGHPTDLGTQIARSVYRSICGAKTGTGAAP
jgi:hypothetical protein